jgi:hypothetical protein
MGHFFVGTVRYIQKVCKFRFGPLGVRHARCQFDKTLFVRVDVLFSSVRVFLLSLLYINSECFNYFDRLLFFFQRYIPIGLLEVLPQRFNDRPEPYFGRNDLETMMASTSVSDWIKLTERILGPCPPDFTFIPKHKANSYDNEMSMSLNVD